MPIYPRKIIVNADDFGLHESVNQAIERAHLSGIVASASIMVLGDAIEDAVRRSRQLPLLDLGLHFCLTGVPGFPPTLSRFCLASLLGRWPPGAIARALRRQLDLALLTHRLNISHIDSHQHLHALPNVMRVVCEVAPEYGIRAVRMPRELPPPAPVGPWRRMQAAALTASTRLCGPILRRSTLRTTDHFAGMAVSGRLNLAILTHFLKTAGPGVTEIVCHPGHNNGTLSARFRWGYDWETELESLCDPRLRDLIDSERIELAGWRDL